LAPAGSWAEHFEHLGLRAVPQPMQKAALAGEITEQEGQDKPATT
jgi:hypothetical protein